nr:hypothetical protein [Tanacetum cinerariifolium]
SSSGLTYDDSKVMMVMSAQVLLDWIMDSGCSYHMTSRLEILFDFLECDGGSVQLSNKRVCKIRGIAKVRIQLRDMSSFVLHNARYIPELKRNLVSLGTLEKEGFTVKLQLGKVKVQCRKEHHSGSDRLCSFRLIGSVSQVESLGGKRYFLSIVDDYSKRLVENQTGRTVKKLRTYNGLEFCNWEFKQLCIESGIARHLTVVGTPQQNRLAEHMNKTHMDKVHCLLIQSGLPKTFWAKATCTAAYLINRSPSTTIEKKTPIEMWSGHPSDYGMLRIFGYVAYSHDKQGKLQPRAIKCVLLGYPEGVKGYRPYRLDDESPKIVTSRNVVFNESVKYKDTLKDSGVGANKSIEELQVEVELQRQFLVKIVKWKAAMKEEMDSLRKNKTWELVDHPVGQKLVILALTAYKDYELEQLDVKTTFLHGNLEEVIYMRQPLGYEQDDMLIACKSKAEIGSTMSLLKKEFDMKELGEVKKILGIVNNGKSVKMPLGGHFKLSLKDCPVRDCDVESISKVPYTNTVGSLVYLMVCMRPDIAYAGIENVGLVYGKNRDNHVDVTCFVDSDFAKDPDKGRSITGYTFLVQGYVVSWKATLQHMAPLSTTEAEYMAHTEAVKEAIWLKGLLEELGLKLNTMAVNASSSSADENISEVSYYLSESESEYEYETSEYYDNSTNYGLFVNNDDDQEIFHDAIESASENFIKNHIDSQKDYDKSDVDHNDSEEKEYLVDKKGIGFANPRYFEKAKDLRPTLYDEKVIGLGYTPMFLTYSDEALEIEKFKRSRENKIEFAYDYGNLNARYMSEKINLEDDYFQDIVNSDFKKIYSLFQQTSSLKPYVPNVILKKIISDLEDEVVNLLEKEKVNLETIESLKSKSFELSEKVCSESENQSENDCLVIEKECDKMESSKVIAPGMFKLNVSKSSCDSKNVEIKLKRKRHLDTLSSVRRPKNSGVI